MAQDITLMGASYTDVPSVLLPKTGGGTATFTDVGDTTATAADVAQGTYFYTAAGVRTAGTASGGTGGITQDAQGYLVLDDEGGGSGGGNDGGLELLLSETRTCSSTSTSEVYKDTLTASVDANCLPLVFVASRVEYTTANRLLCYSTLLGTNLSTGGIAISGYPALVKGSSNGPTCSLSIVQYGIYPKSATIENGTLTVPIYMKYNSSSTGTISGDYTISVYGLRFDTGVTP